jgi:hypothetical protein
MFFGVRRTMRISTKKNIKFFFIIFFSLLHQNRRIMRPL